jgi:hypothetical protein
MVMLCFSKTLAHLEVCEPSYPRRELHHPQGRKEAQISHYIFVFCSNRCAKRQVLQQIRLYCSQNVCLRAVGPSWCCSAMACSFSTYHTTMLAKTVRECDRSKCTLLCDGHQLLGLTSCSKKLISHTTQTNVSSALTRTRCIIDIAYCIPHTSHVTHSYKHFIPDSRYKFCVFLSCRVVFVT